MKRFLLLVASAFLGCGNPSAIPDNAGLMNPLLTPALTEMSFDEFLHNILSVKIPIRIAIPSEYKFYNLKNAPLFSSYWMTPQGAETAQRSDDLPIQSGWVCGELSDGVTFNEKTKQFIGIDLSSSDLKRAGFKVLGSSSVTVGNYPVLFVELIHQPTSKPIYMMYVPTLLEGQVVKVTYRPPHNNQAIGDLVWASIKRSISAV